MAQKLIKNKPSWDTAPEHATYLLKFKCGIWGWSFSQKQIVPDDYNRITDCMNRSFGEISFAGGEDSMCVVECEARPTFKTIIYVGSSEAYEVEEPLTHSEALKMLRQEKINPNGRVVLVKHEKI